MKLVGPFFHNHVLHLSYFSLVPLPAGQSATQITMNHKYKEELLAQIQANEEHRKKLRQEYLEEGAKLRHAQEVELQRLTEIKAKKLRELEHSGVPPKYTTELAGLKIKA